MRADHTLVPLRSRHMYDLAAQVYGVVLGNDGFEDDLIFFDLIDDPIRAAKPSKNTLLHNLITSVIGFYLDYSTGHAADLEVEFYKSFLEEADLKIPKWLNASLVETHIHKLDRMLGDANEIITPTIFYLLFSDRRFLIEFQRRIASYVRSLKFDLHPNFLVCDGVLKRPKYLPTWLKAGVFYRDRGRCQNCFKDLSGLGRPINDLHLDHIIPLAASGSNDPTNFQLLCDIVTSQKEVRFTTICLDFHPTGRPADPPERRRNGDSTGSTMVAFKVRRYGQQWPERGMKTSSRLRR